MSFNLTDIQLSFDGNRIIQGLDLDAQPGEIICLLGPSGCGKTTTLRVLAGLEHPNRGQVSIADKLMFGSGTNLAPEQREVGYLFQDYALFPHLSVAENVGFGIQGHPDAEARIHELLASVNLETYADASPSTLSGGQQQRVALARALARQPNLVLLDEPFSGLDTALKLQLRESTHRLLKRQGTTAVIVTHDPEEAMYMADRIALMDQGRIVQLGSPTELYQDPINEFCARFLGETLVFKGDCHDGLVRTVAGEFSASDSAPTGPVQVLTRPERLDVMLGDGPYQVFHKHFIGVHTLVDLIDPAGQLPDLQIPVPTSRAHVLQSDVKVRLTCNNPTPLLVTS